MKVLNKQFFIGFLLGIVLIFSLFIIGGVVITQEMRKNMESIRSGLGDRSKKEMLLKIPPIPSTQKLAFDWRIQTLEGEEIDFSVFEGKVIFLNFWATWCAPCVAEMAAIQRLYESLKEEGLEVVCISNEKSEKVEKFVDEKEFTIPIFIIKGLRPKELMTKGIPATFIISKDGMIEYQHIGSAKWDDDTVQNFIRKLL